MDFTENDFNQAADLAELLANIDSIDANYVDKISDEIYKYQPFFLSVMLGYNLDVTPEEMDEIMKIHLIIWLYFRSDKNVLSKKITQAKFEKMSQRNFQMLKYNDGEKSLSARSEIYGNNLQQLKSKALIAAIFFRVENKPVLIKMDAYFKGCIMIGVKSFIECFETI